MQFQLVAQLQQLPLHTQRILIQPLQPLGQPFHGGMQRRRQIVVILQPEEHPLHAIEYAVQQRQAAANVEQLPSGWWRMAGQIGILGLLHHVRHFRHKAGDIITDGAHQQIQRARRALDARLVSDSAPDDIPRPQRIEPGGDQQIPRERHPQGPHPV